MKRSRPLTLKKNHGWKSKPGYKICVIDRGAVRFDFPGEWLVRPSPDSVKIHDVEPPDDNCVLAVSQMHLPDVRLEDGTRFPLGILVTHATDDDEREVLSRGELVESKRGDLEICWRELRYIDKDTRREAMSRLAIARSGPVQGLITFDYWADMEKRFVPVWNEVLRSLVVGWFVEDPTRGPVVQ